MASNQATTKEWVQSLIDPAMILTMAVKCTSLSSLSHDSAECTNCMTIAYINVCLEATFLGGDPLAFLLRTEELRDEAFGRFWVGFSGMYHVLILDGFKLLY